ncbi:MAG: divergent polysaccharide deacetylase family protein [Chitinispirillaceae bacterium]|nr:divergent polysaccharide deacetylase family protein [Chitinispirillaceae bacterium]
MRLKIFSIVFFSSVVILAIFINLKVIKSPSLTKINLLFNNKKEKNSAHGKDNLSSSPTSIKFFLLKKLEELETRPPFVKTYNSLEDSTIFIEASIPKGKPFEWIIWYLFKDITLISYYVDDCFYNEKSEKGNIILKSKERGNPIVKIFLTRGNRYFSKTAKIAIVFSDFYLVKDQTIFEILSFPQPFTVSLVINNEKAIRTAQNAIDANKEVIILLPMEPIKKSYKDYITYTLFLHDPEEKIKGVIKKFTQAFPMYAGFSNLGGAKIIEDSRVMRIVFSEISQEKESYFLFNPVSKKSVIPSLSKELNVSTKSIDIVLDSTTSSNATLISDTLHNAAVIAHKTGKVIIQTYPSSQVISALRSSISFLKQKGIELVFVSDVIFER